METIGNRMSLLMKQKGISNIEMADCLGVDASYVAKFKNDSRRPNTYQIDKIARKLNITTDYLLGNETIGLPFYLNYFEGNPQGISLMSGITQNKHFCLNNKWDTLNDFAKDDLLVFAKPSETTNNKIVLVSFEKKNLILGRLNNGLLYFDNGLAPINIEGNDKYEIEGKLIRAVRYYN